MAKTKEEKLVRLMWINTLKGRDIAQLVCTQTVRIIRTMKRRKCHRKAVLFSNFGVWITAYDFTDLSEELLRELLPNRIGIIADREWLTIKDFDFYTYE